MAAATAAAMAASAAEAAGAAAAAAAAIRSAVPPPGFSPAAPADPPCLACLGLAIMLDVDARGVPVPDPSSPARATRDSPPPTPSRTRSSKKRRSHSKHSVSEPRRALRQLQSAELLSTRPQPVSAPTSPTEPNNAYINSSSSSNNSNNSTNYYTINASTTAASAAVPSQQSRRFAKRSNTLPSAFMPSFKSDPLPTERVDVSLLRVVRPTPSVEVDRATGLVLSTTSTTATITTTDTSRGPGEGRSSPVPDHSSAEQLTPVSSWASFSSLFYAQPKLPPPLPPPLRPPTTVVAHVVRPPPPPPSSRQKSANHNIANRRPREERRHVPSSSSSSSTAAVAAVAAAAAENDDGGSGIRSTVHRGGRNPITNATAAARSDYPDEPLEMQWAPAPEHCYVRDLTPLFANTRQSLSAKRLRVQNPSASPSTRLDAGVRATHSTFSTTAATFSTSSFSSGRVPTSGTADTVIQRTESSRRQPFLGRDLNEVVPSRGPHQAILTFAPTDGGYFDPVRGLVVANAPNDDGIAESETVNLKSATPKSLDRAYSSGAVTDEDYDDTRIIPLRSPSAATSGSIHSSSTTGKYSNSISARSFGRWFSTDALEPFERPSGSRRRLRFPFGSAKSLHGNEGERESRSPSLRNMSIGMSVRDSCDDVRPTFWDRQDSGSSMGSFGAFWPSTSNPPLERSASTLSPAGRTEAYPGKPPTAPKGRVGKHLLGQIFGRRKTREKTPTGQSAGPP